MTHGILNLSPKILAEKAMVLATVNSSPLSLSILEYDYQDQLHDLQDLVQNEKMQDPLLKNY